MRGCRLPVTGRRAGDARSVDAERARQVDEGLRRLRDERIELLQLHRVDPEVPLAGQLQDPVSPTRPGPATRSQTT